MYGLIVKLQGKQRDNLCDFIYSQLLEPDQDFTFVKLKIFVGEDHLKQD